MLDMNNFPKDKIKWLKYQEVTFPEGVNYFSTLFRLDLDLDGTGNTQAVIFEETYLRGYPKYIDTVQKLRHRQN